MRNAETVLGVIRTRGSQGLPLEDVYRQLFNRELYLLAYGRLAQNKGAMTPGVTSETIDGMSLDTIDDIIGKLRTENYRWSPVRRTYIEKKNSTKRRPLGQPTWSDKLLQEVMRLILDAYYDPQFSDRSHGFRPGRGCHTALKAIHHPWNGTVWFIEGDIKGCFDNIDHEILLDVLRQKIHDGRFIQLIANLLKAGYLEKWKLNTTLSGTPQGGVVSPILSNIYLDQLDKFVENVLIPDNTRGKRRKASLPYTRIQYQLAKAKKRGDTAEFLELRKKLRSIPAIDTNDPGYRRLKYIRYADDFLLGFDGPRSEAENIKDQLRDYLRDHLKLELSEEKTLITNGRTQWARFLGYGIHTLSHVRRRAEGTIVLSVPPDVIRSACQPYLQRGRPIHRAELLNDTAFSIVAQYESERRGIVQYYQLAYNVSRFSRLKWIMQESLTKTLASKLNVSVSTIYKRYRTTIQTERGPRVALQVTHREDDKTLVATWGQTPQVQNTNVTLRDVRAPRGISRNELVKRLLANECEQCGSTTSIQVHHIRALKDLNNPGRPDKPTWKKTMSARRRKTMVVCKECHDAIHAGRTPRQREETTKVLESRVR